LKIGFPLRGNDKRARQAGFDAARDNHAMHRLFLLFFAFLATNAAAQIIVPFAKGQATLKPPPDFTHRVDEDGQTMVLTHRNGLAQVRFTYHAVPATKGRPHLAREFVIDTAKKKDKKARQMRNGRSVGFVERGPAATLDDEPCRTLQGMLTLGQGYVTLVVLVPEKNVELPEMREFMKTGLDRLMSALDAAKGTS
jgi:hypothetical protein